MLFKDIYSLFAYVLFGEDVLVQYHNVYEFENYKIVRSRHQIWIPLSEYFLFHSQPVDPLSGHADASSSLGSGAFSVM